MVALTLFAALQGCVAMSQYEKVQKENARLHERVEKLDARIDRQVQQIKDLKADLAPLIERGVVTLEVVDGRVTLGLKADVLFASGSADLSPDGKQAIAQLTRALKQRGSDQDFQVEGHTDGEPIHTAQYPDNWYLGAARAITVAQYMVDQGFPRDQVSAATFADTRPVVNREEAARNRRIEIVLVPDMGDMPGVKRMVEAGAGERQSTKKKVKK